MKEIIKYILFWLLITLVFAGFLVVSLIGLHEVYIGSFFPLDTAWKDIALAIISGIISGFCVYFYTTGIKTSLKIDQEPKGMPIEKVNSKDQIKFQSQKYPTENDIEIFCKSIIAWKVSASKKDEMFTLFKDNPYYLIGYFTFITQKNIEETKILQIKTIILTVVMAIIAIGSMCLAIYTIGPQYYLNGVILSVVVLIAIWYVIYRYGGNKI
jgi:uncharacterized membrane protein YqjE